MIPWWGWIIIWVCLVLALLAVLVISAVRLFRKAVAVLDALGDLTEKLEILEGAAETLDGFRTERALAVSLAEVEAKRAVVREASHRRRAARRYARVQRGRALTKVDASTRQWFPHD